MYVRTYVCMYAVCMHVCMYVCTLCACMYVCTLCACMYVCCSTCYLRFLGFLSLSSGTGSRFSLRFLWLFRWRVLTAQYIVRSDDLGQEVSAASAQYAQRRQRQTSADWRWRNRQTQTEQADSLFSDTHFGILPACLSVSPNIPTETERGRQKQKKTEDRYMRKTAGTERDSGWHGKWGWRSYNIKGREKRDIAISSGAVVHVYGAAVFEHVKVDLVLPITDHTEGTHDQCRACRTRATYHWGRRVRGR